MFFEVVSIAEEFTMCVVPRALAGDQEYDQHVHAHGRRHRSAAEYLRRRDHYYANKKFIDVGYYRLRPVLSTGPVELLTVYRRRGVYDRKLPWSTSQTDPLRSY